MMDIFARRDIAKKQFVIALAFVLLSLPAMVAIAGWPRFVGQTVTLRTRPLDPWDPMMGQHMIVRLNLGELDCGIMPCGEKLIDMAIMEQEPPEDVYVSLVPDAWGRHIAKKVAVDVEQLGFDPYLRLEDWTVNTDDNGKLHYPPIFTHRMRVKYYFQEGTQDEYAASRDEERLLIADVEGGRITPKELIVRELPESDK